MRSLKSLMLIAVAGITFGCTSAEKAPEVDVAVKAAGEVVKIEVGSSGYTPKRIGVKKGQPVKLSFHRKDGNNCGEELVFPSLNLKKALPVGQEVEVEITPTENGEIKFTCGMAMFKGALIVSE